VPILCGIISNVGNNFKYPSHNSGLLRRIAYLWSAFCCCHGHGHGHVLQFPQRWILYQLTVCQGADHLDFSLLVLVNVLACYKDTLINMWKNINLL